MRLRRRMLLRDAAGVSYIVRTGTTLASSAASMAAALDAERQAVGGRITDLATYKALSAAATAGSAAYAETLRQIVTQQKSQALSNGVADAQALVRKAKSDAQPSSPSLTTLLRATTEASTGRLGRLITSFGTATARSLQRAAKVTGAGKIEPAVRAAAERAATRAAVILHNETMSTYRDAQQSTYASTEGIDRWTWMSQLGRRTCAICYAKHGQTFPVSERFSSHIGCRCAALPVATGARAPLTPGAERFARLSKDDQRAVLGPSRLAAYEQGMELGEMVEETSHPVWGSSLTLVPLSRL